MRSYRLTTENGETVATESFDDAQAAVLWRTRHPFEAPTSGAEGRHLRLEVLDGDSWIEIRAGGATDAS